MAVFEDPVKRFEHFYDHGADFSASDEYTYEAMANRFLTDSKPIHVLECLRGGGDLIRFDPRSNAFGVLARNGIIRTYYKPVRCQDLPTVLRNIKRCHNHATNEQYFRATCNTW